MSRGTNLISRREVWTIPAARMKGARRASRAALTVASEASLGQRSEFVQRRTPRDCARAHDRAPIDVVMPWKNGGRGRGRGPSFLSR
jgi:hypothetical protein